MTLRDDASAAPDWGTDERLLFDNRFARWGRRWSLAGVVAIACGVAIATGTEHTVIGILLGSLVGTLAIILGFAFWVTGRSAQGQLDRVHSGGFLVRWMVERDRWMIWYDERQGTARRGMLIIGGMLLFLGLLLAGMMWDDGHIDGAKTTLLITLGVVPLSALITYAHRAPPPRPSVREIPVVVGPHGALTFGTYMPWRAFGVNFVDARVESEPPTLAVVYSVRAKHTTVEHTLNIPVPHDRIDEAHEVVSRLIAENLGG